MSAQDNSRGSWDAVAVRLRGELAGVPPERVAVLCVGNPQRGDDGFGPAVGRRVEGRLRASLFLGGTVPENELPRIAAAGPRVVIVVDAVHWGAPPGSLRLFGAEELRHDDVSTHGASLSVLAEFLALSCDGEGLSEQMAAAASGAAHALEACLGGVE